MSHMSLTIGLTIEHLQGENLILILILELLARVSDELGWKGASSITTEPMGLGEAEFSKNVSQRVNSDVSSANIE